MAWVSSTIALGVIGGLAWRQIIETRNASFLEAFGTTAFGAAISFSLMFAVIVFPVGLFLGIRTEDLIQSDLADSACLIQQARDAAAAHLRAPMYIVEYAKSKNISLDDVHLEVRQGLLSTHWHNGICFVETGSSFVSSVPSDQNVSHAPGSNNAAR
jgi:hypothetical protein